MALNHDAPPQGILRGCMNLTSFPGFPAFLKPNKAGKLETEKLPYQDRIHDSSLCSSQPFPAGSAQ